jgi:MerR family copper efflux transcriptional regulator
VRFYEAVGVLPRPLRASSGYRTYTEDDLDLLRVVAGLRDVGCGLADIREVVHMRERGIPPPDRIIALLHARVSEVDRDISALRQQRGALAAVLERMHRGGADVRLCRVIGAAPSQEA